MSQLEIVLGAATSVAAKMNEETMTYLDKGQAYKVQMKIKNEEGNNGKKLKSILRVGFQDPELQATEADLIAQWRGRRQSQRLIKINIPISYGLLDVSNDPDNINLCEFSWDPTEKTGVFIEFNCTSSEFKSKKRGERGAAFRIQIETFSLEENYSQRLHVAACQVKVFRPKGADRKNKIDREQMSKRPQSEQDEYKPSYDCTVFTQCAPDALYCTSCHPASPSIMSRTLRCSSKSENDSDDDLQISCHCPENPPSTDSITLTSEKKEIAEFTVHETAEWLKNNNFTEHAESFGKYNGSEILKLSKGECIKICGLPDGIRLSHYLHPKPLGIIVRLSSQDVSQAIYMFDVSRSSLIKEISLMFPIATDKIHDLQMQSGTNTIYSVTDMVVKNLKPNSSFVMELIKHEDSTEKYILLLKKIED